MKFWKATNCPFVLRQTEALLPWNLKGDSFFFEKVTNMVLCCIRFIHTRHTIVTSTVKNKMLPHGKRRMGSAYLVKGIVLPYQSLFGCHLHPWKRLNRQLMQPHLSLFSKE